MKSLEALEELKDEIIPNYALEYEDDEGYKDWVIELYNIIKQDLEAYEQLEKENNELLVNKNFAQGIAIKYKKVIEILKDKRVNIDLLLNSSECPTYNFYAKKQDLEDLTQQDYDLLKEVFKDEIL